MESCYSDRRWVRLPTMRWSDLMTILDARSHPGSQDSLHTIFVPGLTLNLETRHMLTQEANK